jgi:hypothetical protein
MIQTSNDVNLKMRLQRKNKISAPSTKKRGASQQTVPKYSFLSTSINTLEVVHNKTMSKPFYLY